MEGKIILDANMVKADNQNKPERADSMDNKGILEVQGLSAWYGKTLAVKNISMKSRQQTITAIIGPSGCGSLLLSAV